MAYATDLFDRKIMLKALDVTADPARKVRGNLQLLGCPYDPNTLKCVLTAAEHGLNMFCGSIDAGKDEQHTASYLDLSEFGLFPILKDDDFIISGADAIIAYIDKRAPNKSLCPTRPTEAGMLGFWVDIAICEMDEKVKTLVEKSLLANRPDHSSISKLLNEITILLDMLEKQLGNNRFLVGNTYTSADIHWGSNVYLLSLTSAKTLLNERIRVADWFHRLQTHVSMNANTIMPFSLLPSQENIQRNELPGVQI